MIDRIYIPTLGRPNTQITYDGLPDFVKDITYLVVQPHEASIHKKLYGKDKVIVLPKSVKGIHNTRKWIYNQAMGSIWGMYDDDLIFLNRDPYNTGKISGTGHKMNPVDWQIMLETTYAFLNNDKAFAGHRLSFLHPSDNYYRENGAVHCAYYFNGYKCPYLNWPLPLAEDLYMVISLLEKGYSNVVWHRYAVDNKEYSEGGCNTKGLRTINKINKAHKKLAKLYPEFVKIVGKKKNKMGEMDKLRISWRKAYESRDKMKKKEHERIIKTLDKLIKKQSKTLAKLPI